MAHNTRLSLTGLMIACALYGESLRPVLLPLNTNSQIIFSGIVIAIGYEIGVLLSVTAQKLGIRKVALQRSLKYFIATLVVLVAGFLSWRAMDAQQSFRDFLVIAAPAPNWVVVWLGSLLVAALLVHLGLLIRAFARWCGKKVQTYLNKKFTYNFTWLLVAGLGYLLLILLVVVMQILVDISSRAKPRETYQKSSTFLSGGEGSLISWEGLGQNGREFVSRDIQALMQSIIGELPLKTMKPIRIYAGIDNEPDLEKRVDLVMREFERTRAFERSVVVMFTPSGSGWVNPVGVESVEFVTRGDSASVSLQYSNNQPILQYIRDRGMPARASNLLFSKIRSRLNQVPEVARPKLYVYGESLGSLGSQEMFQNTPQRNLVNEVDGALWVGSPASGPLWSAFGLAELYSGGESSLVRVEPHSRDLTSNLSSWGPPRLAFLFNSTDPIVWSNPLVIYKFPRWLKEPRFPEVSKEARWLPLLTFGHMWFELFSAKNLPSGIGHNYDQEIPCAIANVVQPRIEEMC
ncbi:MAG: alpha/beta-hydrolase family protein [Candidatus Woykebacteria bacterium]